MQILRQRLCYTKALYRRFRRRREGGSDLNIERATFNQQRTSLSLHRAGSHAGAELNTFQMASVLIN
jgi:hypothetical protein